MARVADAFARARNEGRAALVIYLCAGDPDLETTPRLVAAAAEAGADVVELGMPFSDPTADGPAIQRASERALGRGVRLDGVLDAVRGARAQTHVPLLLFGYYNPILVRGEEAFARDASEAGVDGMLVVDLPPEEASTLREAATAHELDYVPLVAPTSGGARIERAAKASTAFLYYVSVTGVTGAQGADLEQAARRAHEIAAHTGRPVALGFGVKTPADVAAVARHADGVVVGSAVVHAIEQAASAEAAIEDVQGLVTSLARCTGR